MDYYHNAVKQLDTVIENSNSMSLNNIAGVIYDVMHQGENRGMSPYLIKTNGKIYKVQLTYNPIPITTAKSIFSEITTTPKTLTDPKLIAKSKSTFENADQNQIEYVDEKTDNSFELFEKENLIICAYQLLRIFHDDNYYDYLYK